MAITSRLTRLLGHNGKLVYLDLSEVVALHEETTTEGAALYTVATLRNGKAWLLFDSVEHVLGLLEPASETQEVAP